MREIMVLKYGLWMLSGEFSDKFTPDIDFTDKACSTSM